MEESREIAKHYWCRELADGYKRPELWLYDVDAELVVKLGLLSLTEVVAIPYNKGRIGHCSRASIPRKGCIWEHLRSASIQLFGYDPGLPPEDLPMRYLKGDDDWVR